MEPHERVELRIPLECINRWKKHLRVHGGIRAARVVEFPKHIFLIFNQVDGKRLAPWLALCRQCDADNIQPVTFGLAHESHEAGKLVLDELVMLTVLVKPEVIELDLEADCLGIYLATSEFELVELKHFFKW
jgi:hypothetical protein